MKPAAKKNFKLTGKYTSSVAAYGKPPKGFRFLNIGEESDPKTDWFWGYGDWAKETVSGLRVCESHVPFIRPLPEDAPVVDSAPPKYTGPKISWGDSLDVGVAKAGKAPKGRAASKVAKTAAPKVTMKDLLARIEALEKKLGGKIALTFGG